MTKRILAITGCMFLYASASPACSQQQHEPATATQTPGNDALATGSETLRPRWVDAGLSVEEGSSLDLMMAATYGRDTAVNNIAGLSSQFTSAQARIALGLRGRRTSMALSHDANVMQFPGSDIALQQYQSTAFSLTHAQSRSTTWGLIATNTYGEDSVRATSSVSLASVNTTSMDGSGVLAGVITGKTLRQSVSAILDHESSATRSLTFGASASFNNFLGAADSNRQFSLHGAFRQYEGPHVLLGVRAEGSHQNFGVGTCDTGTLMGFATVQVTSRFRLDGSAGPSFGSAQCTGHYQFEALASQETIRRTRIYVGASRRRGNGSVAGSLWETTGFGGLQFGDPRRFTIRADSGYSNYHGGDTSMANNISGYFFSGELRRQLGSMVDAAFTTRHFQRTASAAELSRTLFFVTFTCCAQRGAPNAR